MTAEAKAVRNAYMKEYREKNRERIREYNKAWRQQHPEKVAAYNKEYWERKAEAEGVQP